MKFKESEEVWEHVNDFFGGIWMLAKVLFVPFLILLCLLFTITWSAWFLLGVPAGLLFMTMVDWEATLKEWDGE